MFAAAPQQQRPQLDPTLEPTLVHGAATLTTAAMRGIDFSMLSAFVQRPTLDAVARIYDSSLLYQLAFQPEEAARLQAVALNASHLYRIRRDGHGAPAIRLLAIMSPGDLMANTPLDFITNHLDVQLDLLFMVPGCDLPEVIPDHDLMFFASSQPDPSTLERMTDLYRAWPRPVLNDPGLLPLLARDRLPSLLFGAPDLFSPPATSVGRASLEAVACGAAGLHNLVSGLAYPVLVRPVYSHAGLGLEKIGTSQELERYLSSNRDDAFYLTAFVDYRGPDGLYRKYRVAFIDGKAHLCHMAVSDHWMVHYLNAGMTESESKRAEEAEAMAQFEQGFAARHAAAFDRMNRVLEFDYYTVDCAELPDGRLLVFEADTAAIVHAMEPPDLFAYKHVQMARVFTAFEEMLRSRRSEA